MGEGVDDPPPPLPRCEYSIQKINKPKQHSIERRPIRSIYRAVGPAGLQLDLLLYDTHTVR